MTSPGKNRDQGGGQEPLRMLLVDRGALASAALAPSLGASGFRIELAPSASYALEHTRGERYDVVVVNADLDGLDAPQLSKTLRSVGFFGVIALLAAKPTTEGHLAALAAGASDYLDQAIPHDALAERLRAHVAGSRIKAVGCLFPVTAELASGAGAITILLTPTLVAVDGRPLSLTRVEERLLARLWAGRGAVISWNDLAASAWMDRRVTRQTLRVHLSQLRRKLQKVGIAIEHVRGEGDRFSFSSHRVQQSY